MKACVLGVLTIVISSLVVGCNSSDERLAEFAQQAAHEQAEQNQRVAEANRLMAESHEQLLEADAQSRTELIALQQDLRSDQAEVGRLRDVLEVERGEISQERRTDSATGAGLVTLGIMIVCLSPLLLAAASLLGLFSEPKDAEIGVVLVDELSRIQTATPAGSSAPPQLNSPASNRSPPLPPSSLT